MERIRIAVAHWGAGIAPVFAGVEGGYFAEHDLDAKLVFIGGHPNALDALVAGDVHFTNTVGPELILANCRRGADAVVIASAISRSAQQISARPGLSTREPGAWSRATTPKSAR